MHKHQRKHKPNHMEQNTPPKNKEKWATLKHVGKETSFRTTNMIKNHQN
jgi:hypothetical protein